MDPLSGTYLDPSEKHIVNDVLGEVVKRLDPSPQDLCAMLRQYDLTSEEITGDDGVIVKTARCAKLDLTVRWRGNVPSYIQLGDYLLQEPCQTPSTLKRISTGDIVSTDVHFSRNPNNGTSVVMFTLEMERTLQKITVHFRVVHCGGRHELWRVKLPSLTFFWNVCGAREFLNRLDRIDIEEK